MFAITLRTVESPSGFFFFCFSSTFFVAPFSHHLPTWEVPPSYFLVRYEKNVNPCTATKKKTKSDVMV